MSARLHGMHMAGYENGFSLSLRPERLDIPRRRAKPTLFFVNSMSDLFHKDVPDSYIREVLQVINETPQHTYQILTKRAERMARYFTEYGPAPSNAWLGVSIEDETRARRRIPCLQTIPAAVRFLSAEPLLSNVGQLNLAGIHWVIVGGESGPRARLMRIEWVNEIFEQCRCQRVAFFFKQWGGWGADGVRRSKKSNGRMFRGKHWDQLPALSQGARRA